MSLDVIANEGGLDNCAVIDAILNRHSVSPKRLAAPGPDPTQLKKLIEAAGCAPDHGKLRPWRFISFPESRRVALADVFEAALLERLPAAPDEARSRAREKAARAPMLLVLVLRLDHKTEVPHLADQYASGGAALQNLLLAAHAMGFGARALSGQAVRTEVFREALGLLEEEELLCFIPIGTPTESNKHKQRPAIDGLLSEWNPVG